MPGRLKYRAAFLWVLFYKNFVINLKRTFYLNTMTAEKLQECINDPRVNVFDIIPLRNGKYTVYTFFKPNESKVNFQIRHQRNLRKAEQLQKTKPA